MNERRAYGTISTLMCQGCRRIFLYGAPQDQASAPEGLMEKFFKQTG